MRRRVVHVDLRSRASRGAVCVDLVGQVRRRADGAVGAPHAEAEPVGDVVLEPRADEDRAPVLVEQRERDGRRDLEAALRGTGAGAAPRGRPRADR